MSSQARAGQRECRTFFSASLPAAGVATSQDCFSGRGTGVEQRQTFRPGLHPLPGGSQARVPALGHLLPARESKHPGQAIPSGKPGETARDQEVTAWTSFPTSRAPTPEGQGGRLRAPAGLEGGWAPQSLPGGGTERCPGKSSASLGRVWAPRAPGRGSPAAAACSACLRPGSRSLPTNSARPARRPAAPPLAGSRFRPGLCPRQRRLVPPPCG